MQSASSGVLSLKRMPLGRCVHADGGADQSLHSIQSSGILLRMAGKQCIKVYMYGANTCVYPQHQPVVMGGFAKECKLLHTQAVSMHCAFDLFDSFAPGWSGIVRIVRTVRPLASLKTLPAYVPLFRKAFEMCPAVFLIAAPQAGL
eukprot:scaffold171620_cov29-Tisochrysis_lutea.AAC.1